MIPIQATHVSGVVISRIDGVDKILLLKRVKGGYWCHVAGGVEAGETGWQTILRELKEETQIDDVELHKADFLEQFYEAKENRILVIPCFVLFSNLWCSMKNTRSIAGVRWKKQSSLRRLPINIISMIMFGNTMLMWSR